MAGLLSWLVTAQAGESVMAQDGDSLARRLDTIESRAAIADLVHGYARFVRRDDGAKAADLFTEDGTFEVRDGHPSKPEFTVRSHAVGRAAIAAHIGQGKGGPHPVPLIHNLMIEVDGDSATENCVMEGTIYGTSHKVFGEYRDTLKRVAGKWHFASRTFTMFGAGSSV
jgi:SnoaL-like domain